MTYVSTTAFPHHTITIATCVYCTELIESINGGKWEHSQVFMCTYITCESPTPTSPQV